MRLNDGVQLTKPAQAIHARSLPAKWEVFRRNGLRYFFYSNEGLPPEPPHVHIKGGGRDVKIWLEPEVAIADSYGFNSRELSAILQIVPRQPRPHFERVA